MSQGQGHKTGYKLWVGDLPKDMSSQMMWEWLAQFDGITDLVAVKSTRAMRPYGLITFFSPKHCTVCKESIERWTWKEPMEKGGSVVRHLVPRYVMIANL